MPFSATHGSGQAALDAIERANLFVVPLDDRAPLVSLPPSLWRVPASAPREDASLARGGVATLHGGRAPGMRPRVSILKRCSHAAAAADFARARGLAERLWERMDSSFQSVAWRRWVRQLPEAVLRARPVLCIQYAWALMDAGEVEASEARLRDAERAVASLGDSAIVPDEAAEPIVVVVKEQLGSLPVRIAVARAYLAQARGDVAATVRHAALALASAADAEPLLRAQAEVLVGFARWANGELEEAYRATADWIEHTRQAGNLAFALASGFYLAEIRIAQGQLREAARTLSAVPAACTARRRGYQAGRPAPASGSGPCRARARR